MDIQTELRKGDLVELANLLKSQADLRYDVVVPASKIESRGGEIVVKDGAARLTADGVSAADARLRATEVFDDGLADKLSIPRQYLRRLRAERVDILDANVNGWLQGRVDPAGDLSQGAPDGRSFLLRGFRSDDADQVGIARALLSDRYRALDNYDVLFSALAAIRETGEDVRVVEAELSERRMIVKVAAPGIEVLAPELLKNYRSPFDGASPERREAMLRHGWIEPDQRPVVFGGFVLSNSETGGGAFTLTPRFIVKACTNGLLYTVDALREVHLGGKLEEGLVRWSADTQAQALKLVQAKTRDAVKTFLDVEYLRDRVAKLEEKAGKPVDEPIPTIQRLAKANTWTQQESDAILTHFLTAGQLTAGGIVQAVTSVAQTVASPDRAYELEAQALGLLTAV